MGLGLLAAETQVAGFGVLGLAGAASLAGAGLLMFDTDSEALSVSVPLAIGVGLGFAALSLFAASKALAVRAAPVHGGAADLVGATGTVRVPLEPVGQVYVDGALWRARDGSPLAPAPRSRSRTSTA